MEVLLVHPGGPFWARKDEGAWSIPKGEHGPDEAPLDAALREFVEELGFRPDGPYVSLGSVKQSSVKTVSAWAAEGDCDVESIRSNTFTIEWPPQSGVMTDFPEVDRAEWFTLEMARTKIVAGQIPFLEKLASDIYDTSAH